MAQQFQTTNGLLIRPGATASYQVQNTPSGLSTSGVLMLVGEADGGPHWSDEEDDTLSTGFGPDQGGDVRAKYISGPLVDAYLAAISPANDPDIVGAPTKIVLIKTNTSVKASGALPKVGGGDYATLADKGYGKKGNLIYFQTTEDTAETLPTTGQFTQLVNIDTVNLAVRVNGGSAQAVSILALALPSAVATALNGVTGVGATGGTDRAIITVSGTLAVAVSGNDVVITRSVSWATTPSVGDSLYIPSGSAIQGGSNQNRGSYVVTAATSNTVSATKLRNASGSPGTVTAPAAVGATSIVDATDLRAFAPITVTMDAGDVVDGAGKSFEIADLGTGNDEYVNYVYELNTTPVDWISVEDDPQILTSATEQAIQLDINRQLDNVNESFVVGGDIALKVGYEGTTASLVIDDEALTVTVTGGSGADLDLDLADYPTIADLAVYINAQTGYSAAVGTNVIGQLSPLKLDDGTFAICSSWGAKAGRIKVDAWKFYQAISEGSVLAQLGTDTVEQAASGLPDVMASQLFMSGGTKGATTDAQFQAAIDALESVRGNFLIPLFSRDAADDIEDGLTDSASSYTIEAINAYCKTHVIKMSQPKKRKSRQAFVSYKGTFADAREAAANMASFRVAMTFQDFKNTSSTGGITQFQPWMGAVLAAGAQAAGIYRPIVHKGINCSGVLQAARDYNDQNDTNVENALLAGLLPATRVAIEDGGGIRWESDQTTYGRDDNFVFNSLQAVYVADLISLSTAIRMEKVFVGKSLADISATQAKGVFEAIMQDFMRLKFITRSDGAEKGWKDLKIKIQGPAMLVTATIFEATGLYFIPINFVINQVTQTAGA